MKQKLWLGIWRFCRWYGRRAELVLKPKGIDVGFGGARQQKVTVFGGSLGLIVDARKRPLTLPNDDDHERTTAGGVAA
ncbi:MAG: hypothetical protein H6668_20870 [Ardenticatenaceae bacterium]|nr:hypothetical protein [Ardenticatenaceae bacterium]